MKKHLFYNFLFLMFLPLFSFAQSEIDNKDERETTKHYSLMYTPYFVISSIQGESEYVYKSHEFENGDRQIDWIIPESIESMEVLKGKKATDKYGLNGSNGVIEIQIKSEFYLNLSEEIKAKFIESKISKK